MSVTLEECEFAVRNYYETADVDVLKFVEEPFGDSKAGHLGEYYILTVDTKCGKSTTMFVKKMLSSAKRPEFVNLVTNKELSFYKYVQDLKEKLPELDYSFLPKLYHITNKTLIMEDLCRRNYKSTKHLSNEQVNLSLKCLSKMHASTIAYQKKIGGDFKEEHSELLKEGNFSNKQNFVGNLYISQITKAVKKLIQHLNLNFEDLFEAAVEDTLNIINTSNNFLNVCCHGDLWCNNILFNETNSDCKLIDFQLLRFAPPAHDVTTLIFHNCQEEVIQKHLQIFYKNYYLYLSNELNAIDLDVKEVLQWEEFEETCRIYTSVAKMTRLIYKSFEAATKRRILLESQKSLDEIMDELFIVEMIRVDSELRNDFMCQLLEIENMLRNPIVSKEDIYRIVSAKFPDADYELVDYKVARCLKRINFRQVYFDLNVYINIDKKLTDIQLILKTITADNCERFRREVRYLDEYPSDVSPNYLLICNSLIVYETPLSQGYDTLNRRKPLSLDEIKLVIQAMAKIHAKGFERSTEKSTKRNMKSIYKSLDLNPKSLQFVKEKIMKADAMKDLIPSTYCHNELIHSNILFKLEDGRPIDCKLINGNYKLNTPSYDFMSLLYNTTTSPFRKFNLTDLQHYYYKELMKMLNTPTKLFSLEAFVDQCEVDRIWAILDTLNYHQEAPIEEILCIDEYDTINMFSWNNDRKKIIMKMYERDPVYRAKLNEITSEIVDFLH